jgi:hypothetical protein
MVDAVTYEKSYLISTLWNYISDDTIHNLGIPSKPTDTQWQTQVPKLCLPFFSNICLILKPCLGLKRKPDDFCAVGPARIMETLDSVLNLKYFIQTAKF